MKNVVVFALIVAGIASGVFLWQQRTKRAPAKKLTPVVVVLKWLHQAQFAGNYVADQKGYYKDAGLAVTLVPFDYKTFPVDEVAAGRAQFGVAGAEEVLVAREQGKKLKALAAIYQESPVVAYALASSGISKPTDFIGKKVGMENTVGVQAVTHAMMAAQGIDYQKNITEVPIDFTIKDVLDHKVDVGTGYATNEPIQVEESGQKVNIIYPTKYGVNIYADVLFTTEDMIASHPDLVRGYVDATIRGWQYALEHVDEAVHITLLYKDPNNTSLNFAHQKALLTASMPFIRPTSATVIGSMNYISWKRTQQLLLDYHILTDSTDVANAYTSDFLR